MEPSLATEWLSKVGATDRGRLEAVETVTIDLSGTAVDLSYVTEDSDDDDNDETVWDVVGSRDLNAMIGAVRYALTSLASLKITGISYYGPEGYERHDALIISSFKAMHEHLQGITSLEVIREGYDPDLYCLDMRHYSGITQEWNLAPYLRPPASESFAFLDFHRAAKT